MNFDNIEEKNYFLLFKKCYEGDIDYIKKFCNYDLINYKNLMGLTLISLASLNNDYAMVKELMKFLPNLKINLNNGHNAFSFAIINNNLEILRALFSNIDLFDFDNKKVIESVLFQIVKGHDDVVTFLIEKGLSPSSSDSLNNNILMYACKYKRKKICEVALRKKFSLNMKNLNGNNALLISIENNFNECANLLINNGIEINTINNSGITPLIMAILNHDDETIMNLLKREDLLINICDNYGNNALMHSILKNNLKYCLLLLERKDIDLGIINNNKETALILSCKLDNTAISEALIKRKADINCFDNLNLSAYDYSLKNNNQYLMKLLSNQNKELDFFKKKINTKLIDKIQNNKSIMQNDMLDEIENNSIDKQNLNLQKENYILKKIEEIKYSGTTSKASENYEKIIGEYLLNNLIQAIYDKFNVKLSKEDFKNCDFNTTINNLFSFD
ncbi:MAG: ankyrin repeat domain-containing protein [Mycoplasmoidaceae bacterium]